MISKLLEHSDYPFTGLIMHVGFVSDFLIIIITSVKHRPEFQNQVCCVTLVLRTTMETQQVGQKRPQSLNETSTLVCLSHKHESVTRLKI